MQTAYFYLLAADTPKVYVTSVCRLLEQHLNNNLSVYLYCSDLDAGKQFDDALWTFRDISFIPHNLVADQPSQAIGRPACIIGYPDANTAPTCDVLFNLDKEVPEFVKQYSQILEVVAVGEAERANSRMRYKQYQAAGYTMKTDRLDVVE